MTNTLSNAEKAQLAQIYNTIEIRVQAAQKSHPVWPCKMGCDACCRQLANPPEITAVEWQHLYAGIQTLPQTIQLEVQQKIEALAHRDEKEQPVVTCPLLDEAKGACRVYDYRPAACRMYGFYVSQHNNQWCQMIEELDQAGKLEGAVLGNYSAMRRQIQQNFGPIRSIVDWWQEKRPYPNKP